MPDIQNPFVRLATIDVSQHVEKKQNLTYLSWAWAVDQLMRVDPTANWEFHESVSFGETLMVSCTVTAFGKSIKMHLPVMDHRNQAVKNPDAFVVNKNMMRCLVKAIACHGLGLYIYAGEDLPADEDGNTVRAQQQAKADSVGLANAVNAIKGASTVKEIGEHLKAGVALYPNSKDALTKHASERKAQLTQQLAEQA
jgi:hypothetical protein